MTPMAAPECCNAKTVVTGNPTLSAMWIWIGPKRRLLTVIKHKLVLFLYGVGVLVMVAITVVLMMVMMLMVGDGRSDGGGGGADDGAVGCDVDGDSV